MKVKERKKLNKRATAFEQKKKSATIFIIKKKEKKTENVVNEHKKSYRAKC